MKKFSVYVGGMEVNDYYMTQAQAENLASQYEDYDDVDIIEVNDIETMHFVIDRGIA